MVLLGLVGAGLGVYTPANNAEIMAALPTGNAAAAGGMVNMTRGMVRRATAEDDRRAVELTVTQDGQQAVLRWQATNAAVLHLALSTLPARQRRALATAVPALDALASAGDRLADMPGDQDSR